LFQSWLIAFGRVHPERKNVLTFVEASIMAGRKVGLAIELKADRVGPTLFQDERDTCPSSEEDRSD
jgi:hypothetical protein